MAKSTPCYWDVPGCWHLLYALQRGMTSVTLIVCCTALLPNILKMLCDSALSCQGIAVAVEVCVLGRACLMHMPSDPCKARAHRCLRPCTSRADPQEQESWLLAGWQRSQFDEDSGPSLGVIVNIDRVVVVTGVSSGIGYGITKSLIAHQCHVFGRQALLLQTPYERTPACVILSAS